MVGQAHLDSAAIKPSGHQHYGERTSITSSVSSDQTKVEAFGDAAL